MSRRVEVKGTVAPRFAAVADAFAENFERTDAFREAGAAVAVFHHGDCVASLWGGMADPRTGTPWAEDTLVNVWSATKGAVACAVARLVDQGAFAYGDRIAGLWPAFAQNGKAEVTIAQVMSHQTGLTGFAEPTSIEDQYDWDACCAKLARQPPVFAPGSATSYQAMTFGWMAGEIVRRATGKTLGAYLRDEITGPLGADLFIGLPVALQPRVARILGPRLPARGADTPPEALMAVINPVQNPEQPNEPAWRAAEIPAANGQTSAMGLARLYAPLSVGGAFDGVRVLSPKAIEVLGTKVTRGRKDMMMGFEDCWGMGMMLNPEEAYGPGDSAFGHSGWGGSFGFADPRTGIAMGYVCNQMGSELIFDPRSVALTGAVARCLAQGMS